MQMLSQINRIRRESIFHKQNNALAILTKEVKITKHTVGEEIGLTCLWDN